MGFQHGKVIGMHVEPYCFVVIIRRSENIQTVQ